MGSVQEVGHADLLSLDGRGAVVTGAARGIGRATVERFVEAGARCLIADLDASLAEQTAAEINAAIEGAEVHATALDVTEPDQVEAAADLAVERFGGIDVWVNNAGIYPPEHLLETPKALYMKILEINLLGLNLGVQEAGRRMIDRGSGGVIVNLASTASFFGSGAYSATKYGVRGITSGMARQLGEHGIRVVAVGPTITETPGMAASRADHNDGVERLVSMIPLGRPAMPDDIARAILFLSSDAAEMITGVTLLVDGGHMSR